MIDFLILSFSQCAFLILSAGAALHDIEYLMISTRWPNSLSKARAVATTPGPLSKKRGRDVSHRQSRALSRLKMEKIDPRVRRAIQAVIMEPNR